MVITDKERDAFVVILHDIEQQAHGLPDHSTTRTALFRIAADLRRLLKTAPVTSTFRGKP